MGFILGMDDLNRVTEDMVRAGEMIPEEIGHALAGMTPEIEAAGEIEVRAVTPQLTGREATSGYTEEHTLYGSTRAASTIGALGLSTVITQPATSLQNWDGSGGGVHYFEFVVDGRGEIQAPSSGLYSTGKKAMRTPMGPRRYVGDSYNNAHRNYPMLAEPGLITATEQIASRWAHLLSVEVAGSL